MKCKNCQFWKQIPDYEYERNWTGKQTGETVEQGRTEKVVDKDREENQEAGE